jgi:hypothetical protein
MRNARAYSGLHESEELAIYPKMKGYFPVARVKVDAAVTWARDLIADKIVMPWVYKPTPDPELSKDGQQRVKQALMRDLVAELQKKGISATPEMILAAGGGVMPAPVEEWLKTRMDTIMPNVLAEETRIAGDACKLAMRYGKDWQMASGYSNAFVPFIRDVYGQVCGVMAGPMPAKVSMRTFKGNAYTRKWVDGFTYRHVHAVNAYFAPDASSAMNGEGFIERTFRSINDLTQMVGADDVRDEAIIKILDEYPRHDGEWVKMILNKDVPSSLYGCGLSGDYAKLGSGEHTTLPQHSQGVESLIYRGRISARELNNSGITGFDDDELVDVEVEVCGNRTIRASLYKGPGVRGYVSTGFTEGDIPWRSCITMAAYDCQMRVNRILYRRVQAIHQQSGAFMALDGASWDGKAPKMEPFTFGFVNPGSSGRGAQYLQAQPTYGSLYQELLNEFYLADMLTAIPRFDRDQVGPAETNTATEAGIRYQAAVRRQKAVAMNLDMEVLRPQGEALYEWLLGKEKKLQRGADAMTDASGIVGGLTDGANKARMVEALAPLINAAQGGLVPSVVVQQALRSYSEGVGIDISQWPDPAEKAELSGAIQAEARSAQSTPAILQNGTMMNEVGAGVPEGMVTPGTNVPAVGVPMAEGVTL